MKVMIAKAAPDKAKGLILGGAVSKDEFASAVDPIAACDSVKMAMELALQLFDPGNGLDESGDYGVIAIEFSTDPKGHDGEVMYDIVQCAPLAAVQQLELNRREHERRRMHHGGPGGRR